MIMCTGERFTDGPDGYFFVGVMRDVVRAMYRESKC